jgi:hypothetical protein
MLWRSGLGMNIRSAWGEARPRDHEDMEPGA